MINIILHFVSYTSRIKQTWKAKATMEGLNEHIGVSIYLHLWLSYENVGEVDKMSPPFARGRKGMPTVDPW